MYIRNNYLTVFSNYKYERKSNIYMYHVEYKITEAQIWLLRTPYDEKIENQLKRGRRIGFEKEEDAAKENLNKL